MKRALFLLAAGAVFGAPAFAQNGSGFQQTQGQSGYGSSASDYGNSWRSDQSQTGSAPAGRQTAQQDQGAPVQAGGQSGKQAKRARKINDPRKMGDGENGGSDDRAEASAEEREAAPAPEAAPARVDLATARENFAGLVDNYVSRHSPKGYWSYVEKKGAKARHLSGPAVDEDSLRQVRAGRFAARVTLLVEGSKKKLPLEFEADLSGSDWRIVAVRPVSSRR